jgi:hypothetical protein
MIADLPDVAPCATTVELVALTAVDVAISKICCERRSRS